MRSCNYDVSDIMAEMVRCSGANLEDIRHFLNVYDYAVKIAEAEKTDPLTRYKLEISALVHDISCPLCREKYGSTDGKRQEEESGTLLEDFLDAFDLPCDVLDSVIGNVCHHHSPESLDTEDFQILIEADAIANAMEKGISGDEAENLGRTVFRTDAGKKLLLSETGAADGIPRENERKWLIREENIPYALDSLEKHKLEQFYVSVNPTIRARSIDASVFILTVKTKTDSALSRIENETPLCREEYENLKPRMIGSVVRKTRYIHPLECGLREEIDIFEGSLEGLAVLEIEFPDIGCAAAWKTPEWAVRDVTLDTRYKNGALALSGRVPDEQGE